MARQSFERKRKKKRGEKRERIAGAPARTWSLQPHHIGEEKKEEKERKARCVLSGGRGKRRGACPADDRARKRNKGEKPRLKTRPRPTEGGKEKKGPSLSLSSTPVGKRKDWSAPHALQRSREKKERRRRSEHVSQILFHVHRPAKGKKKKRKA